MHATSIYEKGVEYFVAPDGKLYLWEMGDKLPFEKVTIDDLTMLRRDLEKNPDAVKAIEDLDITDPVEQLRQYAWCRYGGTNVTPDFIDGKSVNNEEYWECGKRGKCPFEGRICSTISAGNNTITHCELIIARYIAKGYRNTEIAWATNKSIETVKQQIKSILQKIDGRSRVDIANFINEKRK